MKRAWDAIVIGSGPNGLAAAITLARAGRSVLLREGAATVGGGCRSAALTLPGFVHDVCSTVYALPSVSPFFQSLPLERHGLELIAPPIAFAHPLDDGTAAVAVRSVELTADGLGADAAAYRRLIGPLVRQSQGLFEDILSPPRLPAHPLLMARFGASALWPARTLAEGSFETEAARALFAGAAAHAVVPLEWKATAAFGLVLTVAAHTSGWPIARGGAQHVADAMASYFRSLGGEIQTGAPVADLDELPHARAILCDISPPRLLTIGRRRLSDSYAKRLGRFRYGPGIFKIDWALDRPIPWTAPQCHQAGTIHLGGTLEEVSHAERLPWRGRSAARPFVLLVQPSRFDVTRAPPGRHTAWAYCHVPNGSTEDRTAAIERQVERFAPGFSRTILARHTMTTADYERYNPNLVGGDVNGGASDLQQLFARPMAKVDPYATSAPGLYLCSASTPPGGGVHGMCGYFAAQSALRGTLRHG